MRHQNFQVCLKNIFRERRRNERGWRKRENEMRGWRGEKNKINKIEVKIKKIKEDIESNQEIGGNG